MYSLILELSKRNFYIIPSEPTLSIYHQGGKNCIKVGTEDPVFFEELCKIFKGETK